jgi:CheY-like chemotaxis protein
MNADDRTMLVGKRILLVEDEFLISTMVEDMLTELGTLVVGPAATVPKALSLIRQTEIDGAVLDVNIDGTSIDEVANLLRERGIPYVLATGYGRGSNPSHVGPVLTKPYTKEMLKEALSFSLSCG